MTLPPPTDIERSFYSTMGGSDAFTVVIKAATFMDYELMQFIERMVPAPTHLKDVRLDYSSRCALAAAFGLEARFLPPLRRLGRIRNSLAHEPSRHLTDQDVDDLFNTMAEQDKLMMAAKFDGIRLRPASLSAPFAELSALDRLILICVVLRAGIAIHSIHVDRIKAEASPPVA